MKRRVVVPKIVSQHIKEECQKNSGFKESYNKEKFLLKKDELLKINLP